MTGARATPSASVAFPGLPRPAVASAPFAAQFVEVIRSEGPSRRRQIDRPDPLADQDQLTGPTCLGPEAIPHFEPGSNESSSRMWLAVSADESRTRQPTGGLVGSIGSV
jgi:hypothetical protein